MAAYFTVNTTKLNGPRNYTTPRDVTCGALVFGEGEYGRIHWDWHEAANGA